MTTTSSLLFLDSPAAFEAGVESYTPSCNNWPLIHSAGNNSTVSTQNISRHIMASSSYNQGQRATGFQPQVDSRDLNRRRAYDTHHSMYLNQNPGPSGMASYLYPLNPQQQDMWQPYPSVQPSSDYATAAVPYTANLASTFPAYDSQQWNEGASTAYPTFTQDPSLSNPSTGYIDYTPLPLDTLPILSSPLAFEHTTTVDHDAHTSPSSDSAALSAPHTPSSYASLPTPPAGQTTLPEMSPSSATFTHKQQCTMFKRAVALPSETCTGPFIPQLIYRPHTNSDRKRYVEEVALTQPLYFEMEGPTEYGVPLVDALHSRVRRLVNREKPVFEGRGPSVSIRLEWPGYRQWTRQIPTKDFRSPPGPITMAKLAKNIAKCVQRFIDENKDRVLEEGADRRWKVGVRPHEVRLEDVVLVSVHHVSLGSWQPQLRLRRAKPQVTYAAHC